MRPPFVWTLSGEQCADPSFSGVDCTLGREKRCGMAAALDGSVIGCVCDAGDGLPSVAVDGSCQLLCAFFDGSESVYGHQRYNRNAGCDSQLCGGFGGFWSAFPSDFYFSSVRAWEKGTPLQCGGALYPVFVDLCVQQRNGNRASGWLWRIQIC